LKLLISKFIIITILFGNGVPEEDARYVLPNGVNTNIVVTMNARELYNFFSLRLCSRAQWEIRKIAWSMLEEVKKSILSYLNLWGLIV